MNTPRSMQKFFNIQHYTNDYLQLVYRYYAEAGINYICTYYNLNIPQSVVDTEILDGGSYQLVGDKSGYLWNRVMLFPVYNTETVQNTFIADERGMGKFDQVSSFNFPTEYGLKPRIHDFVMFEEIILDDDHEQQYKLQSITDFYKGSSRPMYEVVHFEKATNTDVTFWKVNLKVSYETKIELDNQLSGDFTFFDLEKHIFKTHDTTFLFKMLEKNRKLDGNDFYRSNCGFYFV